MMQTIQSTELGDYFNNFINEKISSGQYQSASEVIRSALRLLEREEKKTSQLISALEDGENSEMISDFNPKEYLEAIHKKHL